MTDTTCTCQMAACTCGPPYEDEQRYVVGYDLSFSNVGGKLPDNADCFLRGFLDFYGVGEAGSFCADGDEDEYGNNCPLSRGTGWAVDAYREGWREAERRA